MKLPAWLVSFLLIGAALPTAAPAISWSPVTRTAIPGRYETFRLDRAALRGALAKAPGERSGRRGVLVRIPGADGRLQRFRAVRSPVLAPALAWRFPQIRTYAARGIDDPTATARFDISPLGFSASVQGEQGTSFVDPYSPRGDRLHVAYARGGGPRQRALREPPEALGLLARRVRRAPVQRAPGDAVVQRTYRLALANDPSYSEYFGTEDLKVESAKASLMNRVNQLYNDDLAIRMELVANDFLLNFKTAEAYAAAGYGTQSCDGDLLDQNQAAIDAIIGDEKYDIGHIVKRAGGGGIAQLGSVGQTGDKAQGCTGVDPPVGDGFAIDYVAHEMGHQFGGQHTFDGANGSCMTPNRELLGTSSTEPGSGTSIQAYAGICDADDLQPNSDPYFAQQSIEEITGYITSKIANATEEGTERTVANKSPKVTAPPDKTIPVQTPFTLPGTATDPDGDGLVYSWEQDDAGLPLAGTPLQTNARPFGPLFRIFGTAATENKLLSPAPGQNVEREVDKVRTFPDPAQIAADNTNAESGLCLGAGQAAVDCFSEQLPTPAYGVNTGRTMHFRLTARDRDYTGGGVSSDDVTLTLSNNPSPFAVTAPEGPGPLVGNAMATVTWSTAGTTAGTPNVKISYSTDGGLTFNYVALASTPNDGSEQVPVPNVATTTGRFKVQAIDNYFFDVSDGNLTVASGAGATPTATAGPTPEPSPAPTVIPLLVPGTTPTPGASPAVTVAPTGTASPAPGRGFLRPDLRATANRPRVSNTRRVRIRVTCRGTGSTGLKRCRGSVRLFARIGLGKPRRIARRSYTAVRSGTRVVTLRIRKRAFRRLTNRGRLRTQVRASANGRKTSLGVILRR